MAEDVFGIVGRVVAGAYHVEGVVAEGGCSVIYRARQGGSSAPVALKLLTVSQRSREQRADFLELFRAETELLFKASAMLPTLVRPLHVDALLAFDGRFVPYLVLEWLEGLTLDALIKQRDRAGQPAIALHKLVRLLTPVARALEHAHRLTVPEGAVSVAHRDLKPKNLFVAQIAGVEVLKLLNFGISKLKGAASQAAGRLTHGVSAPAAFTAAYAAPEQWAPNHYGQTGPWTDVWGLAMCIVETLAARPVIEGDWAAMMGSALDRNRRPTPRSVGVAVPDAVEAVFARALALDPRARQPDAGVFWDELTAALQAPQARAGRAAPYDVRAESTRLPRIELLELPSSPAHFTPRMASANPAVQRALPLDLEFDPISSSARQILVEAARVTALAPLSTPKTSDSSGQHFVPDLELAPASVARRPSGARPIEQPARAAPQSSLLDLEEDPEHSASLDLDLHPDEPLARRAASSPRMAAVQLPARRQSPPPPRSVPGSPSAARETKPEVTVTVRVARASLAELDRAPDPLELGPNSSSGPRPQPRALPPPGTTANARLDTGFLPNDELSAPEERPLLRRLRLAFALLGAAVLMAVLDPLYAAGTGAVWQIMGVRSSLFSGALLVLALALAAREALRAP